MQIYFVFAADYVGIGRKDASKWTALTESATRIECSVISPFQNTKNAYAFLYFERRGEAVELGIGNWELGICN